MKKSIILIGFLITVLFLSGCQEQKSVSTSVPEGIEFKSDLVELVYGEVIKVTDSGKVVRVDVQYRFKNIADRNLRLNVFVEFCNEINNSLYTGGPKIIELQKGWTEQGVSPANIISYSGIDASEVDHVKLVVSEQ